MDNTLGIEDRIQKHVQVKKFAFLKKTFFNPIFQQNGVQTCLANDKYVYRNPIFLYL